MSWRRWFRRPQNPKALRVHMTPQGLSLAEVDGDGGWQITWAEVVRVTTFKRDLFAYDRICMEFSLRDGQFCCITEEAEGFTDRFAQDIALYLPIDPNWYIRMAALPAFETNLTTLMERT